MQSPDHRKAKKYNQKNDHLDSSDTGYILFGSDIFMNRGGIADYTDNFAKQLRSRGLLVKVISPFAQHAETARPYVVQNFKLNYYRRDSSLDRWWLTRKTVTLFHFVQLFYQSLTGMHKLVKDKKNTTVIFTEYYSKQFDIVIYCARLLRIKYSIVFHGLDLIFGNNKEFAHFRNNLSGARFIIFNSESTEALCRRLFGIAPGKSVILYPGIDTTILDSNPNGQYKGRKFLDGEDYLVFTTVSRLIRRKGIDIAIRIVHALAGKNLRVRYYIGGVGQEMENLRRLIKELGAEEYIFLMGELTDEEKYRLLSTSDFFLLPNHSAGNTDFEGFGISFIEASLFGNVVIGGKHGGVKEAVADGSTGFLFDFDDPAAFEEAVDAIWQLARQPEKIVCIKTEGICFVKKKYDWKNLIENFIRFEKENRR